MSPGVTDRAADATAAVFAAGKRRGSGVRVDGRHVLTAAHVVRNTDTFAVLIPGAKDPLPATLEAVAASELDVALLAVDDLPADLERVPLSPVARLPERVKVFGFPLAEKELKGVWRDLISSGRAGRLVQGDWDADAGSMVGHSGGPVVDATTGALVGVLVEGAEQGRFDRFAPLSELRTELPGLRVPWLFAGEDARGHFDRRALGQRSVARGGDLFRGRGAALDAIDEWLKSQTHTELPMVITGQPGRASPLCCARRPRLRAGGHGTGARLPRAPQRHGRPRRRAGRARRP